MDCAKKSKYIFGGPFSWAQFLEKGPLKLQAHWVLIGPSARISKEGLHASYPRSVIGTSRPYLWVRHLYITHQYFKRKIELTIALSQDNIFLDFNSRTRRHKWVEFVVGSRPCSERFFSGYSSFPTQKPTFPNYNSV